MKKKAAKDKLYQITMMTKNRETHAEYLRLSKVMRSRGIAIGPIVPGFLVEKLREEEANGFDGLKKYI